MLAVALARPLLDERAVDDVDRLDEERAGARRRVEDGHEAVARRRRRRGSSRPGARLATSPHVAVSARPSSSPNSVLEQLVDRADDVRDDGSRRVEDAALHPLLGVVLLEEELVEVDDRVLERVRVPEVADDGLHVGVVEQLDDLADAELVEVDPTAVARRVSRRRRGGTFHQLLEERVGAHVRGEVVGRVARSGSRSAPRAGRRRSSARTCRRSRPARGRGRAPPGTPSSAS